MAMKIDKDMLLRKTETLNPIECEINENSSEENPALNTLYPKDVGTIVELDINKLNSSPLNNFKPIEGENWEEFKKSIEENGILNPVIVRADGNGGYEILAGHNRIRAAKEVGLSKIPAIIKNVDDINAAYIVADTNLQREKVSDLEKGWAYRVIYEAIARQGQGKRNDLLNGLEVQKVDDGLNGLEVQKVDDSITSTSYEVIAEKYGINEKTVRRKIRLTYLLPQLYEQFEKKLYTQDAIIYLSYLKQSEQSIVYGLREDGIEFDVELAKSVKELSEKSNEPIGANAIRELLHEEDSCKEKKESVRSIKYKVDESLLPSNIVKKQGKEEYINKALKYIVDNGITL
ncbi:ParB/RepB/Spo0J family partition protein [Anaerofustis stercorihominis]|uniref:ParB/RepB/Spo0J family partition protein n=1 Tax=Anaerofustis stercorihominis TaxID=214853 RepID=UPI003983F93E